jgi:dipeptide/tripeptide permease
MEIFERMSWYGFFALSSIYMTGSVSDGCLGFTSEQRGLVQGIVSFCIYLFPFATGALGDRFGFKKMLLISYCVLSPSYYLLGQVKSLPSFFLIFMLVGVGAAIFKPLIVGTIAKTTNDKNSSMGFGIFYMMVNFGGFFGPICAAYLRTTGWEKIFIASSIWIALNIPIVLLFYKEPPREKNQSSKSIRVVISEMVEVLGNGRFFILIFVSLTILTVGNTKWLKPQYAVLFVVVWIGLNFLYDFILRMTNADKKLRMRVGNTRFLLFLLLLSSFWVAFNQIFMTLPEYIRDFTNSAPAFKSIYGTLGKIGLPEGFLVQFKTLIAEADGKIKPEHFVNINALAIIFFQLLVSFFVARMKPLVTIMVGIAITAGSFLLLIMGVNPWISMLGVFVFSFGEMMASPKAKEYTAHYVAPQDKVGMYMGYYMWSNALGYLFGGLLSGQMYGWLARDLQRPDIMWIIFASLSVFCAGLIFIYHRTIGVKVDQERAAAAS